MLSSIFSSTLGDTPIGAPLVKHKCLGRAVEALVMIVGLALIALGTYANLGSVDPALACKSTLIIGLGSGCVGLTLFSECLIAMVHRRQLINKHEMDWDNRHTQA